MTHGPPPRRAGCLDPVSQVGGGGWSFQYCAVARKARGMLRSSTLGRGAGAVFSQVFSRSPPMGQSCFMSVVWANGRVEGGVACRQAEVWAKGGVLDSWTKVRVQHWTRRGNIRSRGGTAGEAMNVWMGLADGQNPEERNFCSLILPLSKKNVILCSLGVKQCKVWPNLY